MMQISQVVAADENNAIGYKNRLLCHLPADLKHFKNLTVGFPVIMGRKTFESMGKPLVNRRNIVVSHQDIEFPGCETAHSIEEAVSMCAGEERISIIGGAAIYKASLNLTDTIYLTRIHHTFEADTFFPELKQDEWEKVSTDYHEADEKNPFPYSFITFKKKR